MNVIFNINSKELKLIDFSENDTYQLSDILFYVTKNITGEIYCIIRDKSNQTEIIKLNKTKATHKIYDIYSVSSNYTIGLDAGAASFALLYIASFDDYQISNPVSMLLDYSDLEIIYEVNVLQNISQDIAAKYKQISEMTKLNIDICKEIQEGK